MKVIQINNVYSCGSTGKITKNLHESFLEKGIDSIVLYGRGQKSNNFNVIKVCSEFYAHVNKIWSFFTGIMYGGCFFSTNRIIRIIKKEKPDIVHLQCINGNFVNIYRLINWLKKNNIKTVLTLHAEFMYTANCGHSFDCQKWKTGCGNCPRLKKETKSLFFDRTNYSWTKMKKAFNNFLNLRVVSVSPWLMNRAKSSPILKKCTHFTVINGVDDRIFKYRNMSTFREELGLSNKKIIFHVTPYFTDERFHLKGGFYLLELARDFPEIIFVVAGTYKNNMEIPNNVVLLGNIVDQYLLANYYSTADLTIVLSRRETFSMAVAESLCCGTPVLAFKAGGPETIAIESASQFVEYGNMESLKASLKRMINSSIDKKTISMIAIKKYSESNYFKKNLDVYSSFED